MYCDVDENFMLPLITFSTASKKSFSVATFLLALIANIPASVHTDLSSAPVLFGHNREINSHLISLSTDMDLVWILKMLARPSRSGSENSTFLSIRPGRSSAGSSVFGLFVANMTLMLPLGSKPSSWVISSNMVRCTSLSPPAPSSNLAPPIASTSSKKIIHAFFVLAISNSSRTILAPSPTYFWTSSEPMTRINVASVLLATARAHRVLPVPGGPYRRIPFGGSIPSLTNLSGDSRGNSTTSLSFSICSLQPPTSEYVTSGFSSTVIIVTDGSIRGGKGSWISYFVLSTPTRMPSSISVGLTLSPRPTTNLAICFKLITYWLLSSSWVLMILVQRATCRGCSSLARCLSAITSHRCGGAKPVSDSLTPAFSLILTSMAFKSDSRAFSLLAYGAAPFAVKLVRVANAV